MNFSHFIAKRIAFADKSSFSRIIVRIAIFTVALSMTVMILASAMISGFKREISHRMFDFWGHLHVTDIGARRFLDEVPMHMTDSLMDEIRGIHSVSLMSAEDRELHSKGGVVGVYGTIYKPGIIRTKKAIEGIVLKGVGADYDWEYLLPYLKEGRLPNIRDSVSEDILLSVQTSNRINLKVGDKMIIYFVKAGKQIRKRFQVCGLYKTGLEEFDKKLAVVDIRRLQDILHWDRDEVSTLEVYVDDLDDLDILQEYLYYEVLPNNLYAQTIEHKFSAIFEWLQLQNVNERVIMILLLVVSIVNMITSLLILILERTNMIGILSALGAQRWSLRKVFIYQAAYIIVYGLMIGNVLGLGLAYIQKYFHVLKLDEEYYYLSSAPIDLNYPFILLLNVVVVLVILISLILPSYLVNKISPIKAIRFR
ncbi:MAG TPA: ABC transporter permease [Saprospiraceae bacterium]|nr:ABC transporter permease [Saprospiraceae bacterium]